MNRRVVRHQRKEKQRRRSSGFNSGRQESNVSERQAKATLRWKDGGSADQVLGNKSKEIDDGNHKILPQLGNIEGNEISILYGAYLCPVLRIAVQG